MVDDGGVRISLGAVAFILVRALKESTLQAPDSPKMGLSSADPRTFFTTLLDGLPTIGYGAEAHSGRKFVHVMFASAVSLSTFRVVM